MIYKRALKKLMQLALLFIAVCTVTVVFQERFMTYSPSTVVLMAMAVFLQLYFSEHIIDRRIRRCLTGAAAMICLWMILRGAKYIAFWETEAVARHIWYMYYVPILATAQLSLYAALCVGKREEERLKPAIHVTAAVSAVLMLLMLTNDLHFLAFRFMPGFEDWDNSYSRGPLFTAVIVWMIIIVLAVSVILFRRCRLSESRRLIWIPMLPALFGVVYGILYSAGLWPRVNGQLFGEMPEAICFSVAGLWISFMGIGLIPSNEDYGGIFTVSSLGAQIADRDLNVKYRSRGASELTRSQLESGSTVMLDADTRLHRRAVSGGYVYWQDDISELRKVNEELSELGERLAGEAELIRLENELRRERASIESRTAVYDEISRRVLPQTERIADLCARAAEDPACYEETIRHICLLGTYIKRYSNMSLLAADSPLINSGELQLAVSETLHRLSEMGIAAELSPCVKSAVPAEDALRAYSAFASLTEKALPLLKGVSAVIGQGELRFTLEGASREAFTQDEISGAALFEEDGCVYVRIPLGKEAAHV